MVRLRMVPSVSSSLAVALHAIAGRLPMADPRLAAGTEPMVADIKSRLLSGSSDVVRFWDVWFDSVMTAPSSEKASEKADDGGAVLAKAVEPALLAAGISELQSDATATAVFRRIEELIAIVESRLPKLAAQLPLRLGPIRSQWDTFGPGLLRHVERQIWGNDRPDDWWPESIEVRMVHPVRGGAGDLNGDGETVWIEALLTDAPPAPPEVLRLAWLALRLATQQHLVRRSGIADLRQAWSLATVPLILEAGRELGVIPDSISISQTMNAWEFGTANVATAVETWWTKRDPNLPMPVSLRDLAVD